MKLLRLAFEVGLWKPVLNVLLILAALAAAFLGDPPSAGATPFRDNTETVCRWLDQDASLESFQAMMIDMVDEGMAQDETVDIVAYAVTAVCPRHYADLQYAASQLPGNKRYAS